MPTIIPIGMTIDDPKKRRTYTRDDYERMTTWAHKNVDFDDTRAVMKKFQRTLDEYTKDLTAKRLDEVFDKLLKARDKYESEVKRAFRKDILEDVYDRAVDVYGRKAASRIKEGWRTAMTLDTYGVFEDLFEEFVGRQVPVMTKEELIKTMLSKRVPDYEYTTKAGTKVKVYLWSKVEENILKNMVRAGKSLKEIKELMPYRTISSIRNKIYRLRQKGEL